MHAAFVLFNLNNTKAAASEARKKLDINVRLLIENY